MNRFDLDGLWTFAHLAFRNKRASGAKAPKFFFALAARLKPCPFKADRFFAFVGTAKAVPFQNIEFFRELFLKPIFEPRL
jgi:hypothetical protein